jgi:hypothetical protein
MSEPKCAYCREVIEGDPVKRGLRVYCSEACAFEDTRSKDCGGRADSVSAPSVVEFPDRRESD